jgi:hypothetical protein
MLKDIDKARDEGLGKSFLSCDNYLRLRAESGSFIWLDYLDAITIFEISSTSNHYAIAWQHIFNFYAATIRNSSYFVRFELLLCCHSRVRIQLHCHLLGVKLLLQVLLALELLLL